MIRLTAGLLLVLLVFWMQVGCGSARRGAPTDEAFTPASTEIQRGRGVFMEYCNGCHPRGEGGLGPAINNKPLPGWLIRFQVRNGLGVMPSFSDEVISDADLRALSSYLVALRRHDSD